MMLITRSVQANPVSRTDITVLRSKSMAIAAAAHGWRIAARARTSAPAAAAGNMRTRPPRTTPASARPEARAARHRTLVSGSLLAMLTAWRMRRTRHGAG